MEHDNRESGNDPHHLVDRSTGPPKHVYVINGSTTFLQVVRQLLQQRHYNVTTSNFVPQSFAMLASAQPDLLILDLAFGEQGKWDLVVALHQASSTQNIRVLLLSPSPQVLMEAQDRHHGFHADSYMLMPVEIDDLLLTIEDLIGTA